MGRQFTTALRMAAITLVIGGLLYPLAVTGVARLAFPAQATGSMVSVDSVSSGESRVVGSALIGQSFERPEYFHSRPSYAGAGYDASASGASNLGPTSRELRDTVAKRVQEVRATDGVPADRAVPVDLVTGSGSGLDPHITVAAARIQIDRVATARGLSREEVARLVDAHTEGRQLGFLGEPRVNVLLLNVALDALGR